MKTLVLPSGKNLVYSLCGDVSQTESEIVVSFTASTTISDIEAIVKDDSDLNSVLFDIGENSIKYGSYSVFESLSKDRTGVYRLVLQKDDLVNKNEQLQAKVNELTDTINAIVLEEIPAIYQELDTINA